MIVVVDGVGEVNVVRSRRCDGAPLVLLHPNGLDLTWWGPQFEAFGGTRQVVALDFPGHGLSSHLSRPPTFDVLSLAVEGVVDALGGGPVDVVGVSVGGMIAQTVALRRPDLVRSLCLVATLCTFSVEVRNALVERARVARTEGMGRIADLSNDRWFTPEFRARRPDMMERSRLNLLQQSGEFHAGMWEMIAELDTRAKISAIPCPTLVVAGDADTNAPPAAAREIADAIPGASLNVMPGVAHFPPFEAPDAFNDILGAFLNTVDK